MKKLLAFLRVVLLDIKYIDVQYKMGILWSIITKVLVAHVLQYMFTRVGAYSGDNSGFLILVGYLTWAFIVTASTTSVEILHKQINGFGMHTFSGFILILRHVIPHTIIYLIHIIYILLYVEFTQSSIFTPSLLYIAASAILTFIIVLNMSFLLSVAYIIIKDMKNIYANIMSVTFFITPVIWSADKLESRGFNEILTYNPFLYLFQYIKDGYQSSNPETGYYSVFFGSLILAIIIIIFSNKIIKRVKKWSQ